VGVPLFVDGIAPALLLSPQKEHELHQLNITKKAIFNL
jgi:hypothetical protein